MRLLYESPPAIAFNRAIIEHGGMYYEVMHHNNRYSVFQCDQLRTKHEHQGTWLLGEQIDYTRLAHEHHLTSGELPKGGYDYLKKHFLEVLIAGLI